MSDKVVLITGAARRIGRAIAHYFHAMDYNVLIHCHQSMQEAEKVVRVLNQQRPASAAAFSADLRVPQAADDLVGYTIATYGRLDVLVNNASVFWSDGETEKKPDNWSKLFQCNLIAPYWLSHAAYPFLEKNQGCIVNLSDIHAEKPLKDYSLYCQSKAALLAQTQSLAKKFAPNVRVNSVAPGAIDWPEGKNALSVSQKKAIIAKTPLKKHGDPVYVAQAVYALAENLFITGENIKVDGGRSLV